MQGVEGFGVHGGYRRHHPTSLQTKKNRPGGWPGRGEKVWGVRSESEGTRDDDLVEPELELGGLHEVSEDLGAVGASSKEVQPALDLGGKGTTPQDAVLAALDELGIGEGTESVLGIVQGVQGDGRVVWSRRCTLSSLRACVIRLVASMSSLQGSVSHVE
jgi:hypothetical protein